MTLLIARSSDRSRRLSVVFLSMLLTMQGALISAQEKTPPGTARKKVAYFLDEAEKRGLTMRNVFGGVATKKYIIETTGTGVAIFDYDNDGWPDIFIVNGTKVEGFAPGKAPTSHLYHNNHDGTLTDVTVKDGLMRK